MIRPKLKKVIHIPLIDLKEYFRKKYQINIDAYWDELIEHHMFRGNDSSMAFQCAITNEIPDEEVADVLPWPAHIKDIIMGGDHPGDSIYTAINSVTVQEWAELYKLAVILQKKEEDNPTIDNYWPGYLVRGLFEAMVLSEYQLETEDDVYYHISW
jgi:hypothetical protein